MARINKMNSTTLQTPGVCKTNTRCLQGKMPFCCRYRLVDPVLQASIKKYGILMPIVVSDDKRPVVIAGHKRFYAAQALKMKEVPVLVADRVKPNDAFLLNLVSNWKQEYSEMDRVKALGTAIQAFHFPECDVLGTVMPLLGLPEDKAVLEFYRKLDQCAPSLQNLLEDGLLPLRGVIFFLKFSKKDQDYFAQKIGARVKLTSSQFLQTGEWLADIMKRTGKDLRTLCRDHRLLEKRDARNVDPRTQADKFFACVRRLRFPGYSRFLEEFEKRRAGILHDAKELRLEPVQGFEEPGFELHTRVKTAKELDSLLRKLSEKRTALNSLFEIVL